MPITFDEVSAEVAPPPTTQQASAPAPAAAPESPHDQLIAELRLLDERRARIADA